MSGCGKRMSPPKRGGGWFPVGGGILKSGKSGGGSGGPPAGDGGSSDGSGLAKLLIILLKSTSLMLEAGASVSPFALGCMFIISHGLGGGRSSFASLSTSLSLGSALLATRGVDGGAASASLAEDRRCRGVPEPALLPRSSPLCSASSSLNSISTLSILSCGSFILVSSV